MKALYRRYRPKSLSAVVGQEQITDILANSIKTGRISHAYLFIGPRGTGKTSVARIFAHEINHFDYTLEDDYLDIIEIDAASNTGVDNIRDLREKAIIAPTKGKYKVYIIDEVHMLSKSAFNALLKTLEEPPEHVVFIMATTDAYKVPVTITSRSQTFTFKLANPSVMFEYLKKIAKTEKIKITDEALQIVVKRGGGSFRDSLSLLDQISTLSDQEIDADLINKALGLPQDEAIRHLLSAYAANDSKRLRDELIAIDQTGVKPELVAEELISEIIKNPENIYLPLLDKLTDVSRSAYPNVKLLIALTTHASAEPLATITTTRMTVQTKPQPAPRAATVAAPITPAAPIQPATTPKNATKAKDAETASTTTTPIDGSITSDTTATDTGVSIDATSAETTSTVTSADTNKDVAPVQSIASAAELWQQILTAFQDKSPVAYPFIAESTYTLTEDKLTIYTNGDFRKGKISKNRGLIAEFLPDSYTIEVVDQPPVKDEAIANIAELMGGGEEVNIDEWKRS